jgi:hypothetical protein
MVLLLSIALRYEMAWGNKRLSSRMNELLADIARWEMDLKDDSVEYPDVERLAEEHHWDIASSDADDGEVEIDQIDIEDIYLEDMGL